ncbi:MAG: hypothetical protein JWN21_637 [Sphingomonas bacterium]|uniref:hypothetical protein n=1 Tax=Sphingomonas bacterium TaxID=1895847 RepID=UPI0026260D47|nr:hypothetical protein [Sphingomonas bacterium]MDB5695094.1 hypothetical protein [Sphingomonas bacterium]
MKLITRAALLCACLAIGACINSGNQGWDFGGEPDPAGGPAMQQAWRGVHEGRLGFRCRDGRVVLFVETWHPLKVPAGRAAPMQLGYRFEAGGDQLGSVEGVASTRGIEIPAPTVGERAPNALLRGLTDGADDLFVTLTGAGHLVTIRFDIGHAAHAHRHVQSACGARPAPARPA